MHPAVHQRINKTHKVMDLHLDGVHIECIRVSDKLNPYRIYRLAAGHKKQIAKYSDFLSVIYFIKEFYTEGIDTKTIAETVSWSKERGSL